ncbi:MAG TPA: DNA polymerase/3'-5' exonuclease PolX [Kiritimatiellia bacterium]|nr:DNA polymerase/3'-5' exonuclease PolX [Kiritimatiellia bacterium]
MPIHNNDLADVFSELADLQEIRGDNPFRVRAYRNAARLCGDHGEPLREAVARGDDLTAISGIGKELAEKIREIVTTGKLGALEKIRGEFPPDVTKMLNLQGLGPKRVKTLLEELQINTLADLEQAAKDGRVRKLPGFGAKIEATLLASIERKGGEVQRFLRPRVRETAEALVAYLEASGTLSRITPAGSFRRGRETIGDLDVLAVATGMPTAAMDAFAGFDDVDRVLAKGETKSSVVLRNGLQVDLRIVPEESYGAALHYFTGSQAHNIAMRRRAQQQDLKLNEYGVFRGEETVAGASEEDVFKALGLPWIAPELREDRGELDAAEAGRLPELITAADIRGDLHNHTTWSDGEADLLDMAEAAKGRGWEYLAITDHSKRLTVANGLDEARLRKQIEEIDRINAGLDGFTLLKGSEVDLLEDGSLDLDDEVLGLLDVVILSVHSKFNLSRDKQTERILRALDHPKVTFVAHPTGRLLLTREPYEVDVDRVLEGIKQRGCFVELNLNPLRLDLNDVQLRMAKDAGILVVANSDAHSPRDFDHHYDGILQARRGWLEPKDVLNTRSLSELRRLLP